ncbi:MAG: ATP-dependent DNA ligase [Candidatus Bathyarchaeota archaeon]|nr:ATP-dependent DNA ligase [Candidatus Bathyarchaeota archaeon]
MKYSSIADAYAKMEATSKRLEMTDYLVELLTETPKELIGKVAYLTQGALYPDFEGIELGMAEKMVIAAIAKATDLKKEVIVDAWKQIGDLGSTVEKLLREKPSTPNAKTVKLTPRQSLTVEAVYDTFDRIAHTGGKGSVERKVNALTRLIVEATAEEAKYLVRTVTGRLRLGIGDMTFLDALAIAYGGGKTARKDLERAYNMSSDLGLVSETVVKEGMEGIRRFHVQLGRPIRPMLCERLTSAEAVLTKLGGKGAAEYKYDGLRIQAHVSPEEISLFSRRLENITTQFPDVRKALKHGVKAESVIVEGECIAVDPDTGDLQPFQVVTQRRGRKHEIRKKVEEIPVILVLFDALFVDGAGLLDAPYLRRREYLEQVIEENGNVKITHPLIVTEPKQLDEFMASAVENGCEGLVIKSIREDSVYQAGARGFLWIKYKREYRSELVDTLDLVVVGAFAGRGRRGGTYGALLMAAYDEDSEAFKTVCKLGTGFDDATLAKLPSLFKEHVADHVHPRVESKIEADYWFVPTKVLEIRGAELTLSPSHTCGLDLVKVGAGLAVRFPRFTGRWRDDKAPHDATTVKEVVGMYKAQLKTF